MIAVNYPEEFRDIGFSEDLKSTIEMFGGGGGVYAEDDIESLIAHLKERSTRTVEEPEEKRLPFLLAAMVIFLGEVVVRRLREIKRLRKG